MKSRFQFICLLAVSLFMNSAQGEGILYGIDITPSGESNLLTINQTTGAATVVGATGFDTIVSLSYDPSSGLIYGVDSATEQLVTINPNTGLGTAVGAVGFNGVAGLAFDSTGTLFAADRDTDQLISINTSTGAGTAIGPIGFRCMNGLAYDSLSDTLFGTECGGFANNRLITIDTNTGLGSVVGASYGFGVITGIVFGSNGSLFGVDVVGRQLILVDQNTGTASIIGSLGFPNVEGLAFLGNTTVEADIDIKPGSDPNSVNLCSGGALPIAIFGSSALDVNDINTDTLRFAEAAVKVVGKKDPNQLCSYQHIDNDYITDLVCHFVTHDIAGIDGESTSANLNGELFDGTAIEGSGSVNIVKDTCN